MEDNNTEQIVPTLEEKDIPEAVSEKVHKRRLELQEQGVYTLVVQDVAEEDLPELTGHVHIVVSKSGKSFKEVDKTDVKARFGVK